MKESPLESPTSHLDRVERETRRRRCVEAVAP